MTTAARRVGPIGQMRRYREIVAVLVKYGFIDMVHTLHLTPYLAVGRRLLSAAGRDIGPDHTKPQRFRMALEELGPTFIKFGQALTVLRVDHRRRSAPCDGAVLAVPPSTTAGRIVRVIVPVDLDGRWERELGEAATVARRLDAALVLVHVVPRIHTPPWLRENAAVLDRRRAAEARRAIERARSKTPSGIRLASCVLICDPADKIAALAARGPASLIVMALRGGLRARKGATTYRVLTHAVAPVLALPRPLTA